MMDGAVEMSEEVKFHLKCPACSYFAKHKAQLLHEETINHLKYCLLSHIHANHAGEGVDIEQAEPMWAQSLKPPWNEVEIPPFGQAAAMSIQCVSKAKGQCLAIKSAGAPPLAIGSPGPRPPSLGAPMAIGAPPRLYTTALFYT